MADSRARAEIVTVADEGYARYLACLILTAGEHLEPLRAARITVIHRGMPPDVRRMIENLRRDVEVMWFDITPETLRAVGAPAELLDLPIHYAKLLAPFVLADRRRCVYIDADTIVHGDLEPLVSLDLRGATAAAAVDCLPRMADAVANFDRLGLAAGMPYMNTGVLVLDLDRWREFDVPRRVLSVCADNTEFLMAQRQWPQHEQYGLNVVLAGKWLQLDPVWNVWAFSRTADTPSIVHYVGDSKPYLPACRPDFRDLFARTLTRTGLATGAPSV